MSAFKERLLGVLERMAEGQERLEAALAENAREVQRLRAAVTSQHDRAGQEVAQVRRRVQEHEVRLYVLEGKPDGAAE